MTRRAPLGRLRRFLTRSDGNATIEFVILVPVFMVLLMSTVEAGIYLTRQVMLERGVDMSVRQLRLNTGVPVLASDIEESVCEVATIIPDCRNVVMLELRPVSTTTWEPLGDQAVCVRRGEQVQPFAEFTPGAEQEMMLVRACVVVDPLFPTTGLGLRLQRDDASGGYHLIATSAFVNEPNT